MAPAMMAPPTTPAATPAPNPGRLQPHPGRLQPHPGPLQPHPGPPQPRPRHWAEASVAVTKVAATSAAASTGMILFFNLYLPPVRGAPFWRSRTEP